MKKLIKKKEISLNKLLDLINAEPIIVAYKTKSNDPYYSTLIKDDYSNQVYFQSPFVLDRRMTYKSSNIEKTLLSAQNAGKEILVFRRNEMNEFYKLL